jgi:hypothetical protein
VCANLIMLSSVTNLWVSDREPSDYLKDLCETEGTDTIRHRLGTCLIDDKAFRAALLDDYDTFTRARAQTLHTQLLSLLGNLGENGDEYTIGADEAELGETIDPDEPMDRDSAD